MWRWAEEKNKEEEKEEHQVLRALLLQDGAGARGVTH